MENNGGNLLFSKRLSATDVKERLHWPSRYVHLLPFGPNELHVDFNVKDVDGVLWAFRCSRRATGYGKHVISSGWMPFLSNKDGVKKDDELFVYQNDDPGEALFIFSLRKNVPLFGTNINEEDE